MPKYVAKADHCFKTAAQCIKMYTNMSLPEAMKLSDFSAKEQACRAKQMVLHHLLNKTKSSINTTPPPLTFFLI